MPREFHAFVFYQLDNPVPVTITVMDFEPKTLGGGEQDYNHRVGYLQTPNSDTVE